MGFRLEAATVLAYLVQQGLCQPEHRLTIEPKSGKNFNLLVRVMDAQTEVSAVSLLLKQEPFDDRESIKTGLRDEWNVYAMLRSHAPLHALQAFVSDAVQFDHQNGILIYKFLDQYQDLDDVYDACTEAQTFPSAIAAGLGATLATLHQATFQQQDYRRQLDPDSLSPDSDEEDVPDFRDFLDITPDIFKQGTLDSLKFYKLVQRYDSLEQAIARLEDDYRPCCLIHNDLKFNNILLHRDWTSWQPSQIPTPAIALQASDQHGVVRLIDWETATWGDPALDVGMIAADYLKIWLKSLMLSRDIELEIALRLATIPLEDIQPSLAAFLQAYISQFPQILDTFPDFVERVLRFTGLALIESIQARLHYREPFGNVEICMLQVAKSLLCTPSAAIATVFGQTEFDPVAFDPDSLQRAIAPPMSKEPPEKSPATAVPLPNWTQHYSLERTLADLVENIQIDSTTVSHPAYAPLELSQRTGDRTLNLPANLRRTYVLRQVRNYLYDIYFSGEQEQSSPQLSPTANLKNNAIAGLDIDFYKRIQSANAGTGFLDPDWRVTLREGDRLQVVKDGLHLWVDQDDLPPGPLPRVGTTVSLRLPNAQFVGEFYMAIANTGEPSVQQPSVEFYFHITSDGAIVLMEGLTSALNRCACPFTFKILIDPTEYGRFDAALLCIERSRYADTASALQAMYPRIQSHLRDPIPLFTKPLAPGIGCADVPSDGNDFGLSRCQIAAQVLLDTSDPSSRLTKLRQAFNQQQLNWHHPYLNPGSVDQYTFHK